MFTERNEIFFHDAIFSTGENNASHWLADFRERNTFYLRVPEGTEDMFINVWSVPLGYMEQ